MIFKGRIQDLFWQAQNYWLEGVLPYHSKELVKLACHQLTVRYFRVRIELNFHLNRKNFRLTHPLYSEH